MSPAVALLLGAGVVLSCLGLLYWGAWALLALGRWLDRLRYGRP